MKACFHPRSRTWLGVSILLMTMAHDGLAACPGTQSGSAYRITGTETTPCDLQTGESVEITTTGSITMPDGQAAIDATGVHVGDIVNAGTLSSGLGVGTIEVGANGSARSISNSGGIAAARFGGIYLNHANVTHGIANSATVSGFYGGIYIYNFGQVDGGLLNSGLATGRSGIYLDHDAVVNGGILNTATGQAVGTNGSGIDVYDSQVNGGIVNAGQVSGTTAGLSISWSSVTGGVSNSGAVHGDSAGLDVYQSTLTGGLQNTGAMTGASYGLSLNAGSLAGGIVNRGRIEATGGGSTGAYLYTDILGGLTNAPGAVIRGDREGIRLDGRSLAGGLINAGDILGTNGADGYGLVMSAGDLTGGIVNTATGRIAGSGYAGLKLTGGTLDGGIQNAGLISGGLYYQGIALAGTAVTGGLDNSGRVLGGDDGVGIAFSSGTLAGGLSNSGFIGGGMGLRLAAPGTLVDGDITNSGTIRGGTTGLRIDDGFNFASSASKIINRGLISGGTQSLRFGATVNRVVDNTGTLLGDAQIGASTLRLLGDQAHVIGNTAGGAGSVVSVEGRFDSEGSFNVQTFDITAPGRFGMNHDVTAEVTNHGTLAIASGALRTVTGNYHQTPGAVFEIGLESGTRYGQLVVTNEAVLDAGATVNVDVRGLPSFAPGSIVPDVLRANVSLTANSPAVTDNSYLFDFTSSTARDPLALDLVFTAVPQAVRTATATQGNSPGMGAAAVLDDFIAGGTPASMQAVISALGRLGSAAQVSDAVRQMLPVHAGGGAQATNHMLHGLHRIIQARSEGNRGLSSGDETADDRYLWVKPLVGDGSQGMRNGVDGATGEQTRLGGSVAYVRSRVDGRSSTAAQRTDIDSYALIGYGTWKLDAVTDINYQLDVAKHDNRGWRSIPFMGTAASAGYGSRTLHAGVGAGRLSLLSEATSVTPSLRLDYTRARTGGYTETGAGALSLQVAASTFEELLLSVDAKFVHEVAPGIKLTVNAALGHDFRAKQAQATSAFAGGGPLFVTQGLDPSPWLVRLGGGAVMTRGENTELTARYDAEFKPSG